MSPRVAVVQLGPSPGGSQNLWVFAFTDPAFSGIEKHLLLPAGGGTRLSEAERRSAQITFHEFGARGERLAQRLLHAGGLSFDPLARALASVDPDLVWFNLAGLGEIGWVGAAVAACRARAIPYWLIVQHVHENFFFPDDAHTGAALGVARGAARVLAVSRRNRAAMALAFGETLPNVHMAVNGVQSGFLDAGGRVAAAQPPRTDGPARFIAPARFDPACKGQHLLLEALSDPAWRDRDWRVTLQGGGEHEELMRRLVDYFGLPAGRVVLGAYTADMVAAYAEADVLLMPSLSEGSPFALVEGMACGRPAVGTPVGGIDELVREGETGWLAHSPQAADVAASLDRCWRDRAYWPERGRSAREAVLRACSLGPAHAALLAGVLADARPRP